MPHKAWIIGGVVALGCLATGCATDGTRSERGSAASTPSVATKTSLEATPTLSPAIQVTDDASTWLISDAGIGPVERGESFGDAVAAMPAGTTVSSDRCTGVAFWSAQTGALGQFIVADDSGTGDGAVVELVWLGMDPSASQAYGPRTAEGIGVGSPWSSVLSTYPDATEANDLTNKGTGLRVGDIWFTSRELEIVESVTVSSTPPAPEYCG